MVHPTTAHPSIWRHRKAKAELLAMVPKPTREHTGKQQFLTLTFNKSFNNITPHHLHKTKMPHIISNMHQIAPKCFSIFPELQENGMLHYHIMCSHNNHIKMKVFRGYWARHFGYTDLKQITPGTWLNTYMYCRKANYNMRHILKLNKYIYLIVNESSYPRFVTKLHKHMVLYKRKTKLEEKVAKLIPTCLDKLIKIKTV